ncbi:REP element-mobilizing transposase RayT [Lentibacillus persicus]|uniref:REP element-mobilizing transposase RayT n=1 Tax=Lentibacillus persicus TaxID=640948 RepID=A0A1I1VWZ5_9BACI|nr:transposase [Lentibacillus persicus]SFD86608.1 REP element-mobilizing transposase RayT [Lentibacillus persicus]
MPRGPRLKSPSGVYHVMMRGVNKQAIFEDDSDRYKLLETLKRYKPVSEFKLYAYCLMNNHIHLLIREEKEPLAKAIQRISSSYVHWYNAKYDRVGPLFQGRYRSENVLDSAYFLTVLRYIHQNPLKAGLSNDVLTSRWTSIAAYYTSSDDLVDVDLGLRLFSPDRKKSIPLFTAYMQEKNDDTCLTYSDKVRLEDEEIRSFLKLKGVTNTSALQRLEIKERNAILLELKEMEGVSVRQLSRLTGISRSVIGRL